jgi:adenosylcobinamide-phosphate synthase
MTAAAIVAASNFHEHSDPLAAWQTWRCDGDEHKSPNAGQPEGAAGGAFHVRLGGDNTSAIRLVSVVTLLGVACGVILSTCVQSREAPGSSR